MCLEDSTALRPLKWYRSLSESKFRREEGYFLVEGIKAIDQVFSSSPQSIEEILLTNELLEKKSFGVIPCRILSSQQIQMVSSVKTSQEIIALVKIPEHAYSPELPSVAGERVLLLENLQDPGNVGTLIRTAAALNYSGVILSGQCADPYSPKVVQATSGCLFSIWVRKTVQYLTIIENLKKDDYCIFAADVHGEPHVDFSRAQKHVLVLGNEGSGLTDEMLSVSDKKFSIPIKSTNAESLNVAVSGGIAMFSGMLGKGW